jgi:hypothetical protein
MLLTIICWYSGILRYAQNDNDMVGCHSEERSDEESLETFLPS